MKIHTQVPHIKSRIIPKTILRSKVKVTVIDYWKGFPVEKMLSCYIYHRETSNRDCLWVKNVPYQFRGNKIKAVIYWLLDWFAKCITASPEHVLSWNFTHRLPLSALSIWGSKVQGHNALIIKKGFRSRVTTSIPLYLLAWKFTRRFPMNKGYALLVSGQKPKGQGPRVKSPKVKAPVRAPGGLSREYVLRVPSVS